MSDYSVKIDSFIRELPPSVKPGQSVSTEVADQALATISLVAERAKAALQSADQTTLTPADMIATQMFMNELVGRQEQYIDFTIAGKAGKAIRDMAKLVK